VKAHDLSPRDIGRVLDDALSIYGANWRSILKLAGAVVFPAALVYTVATVFITKALTDLSGSVATGASSSGALPTSAFAALTAAYSLAGVGATLYLVAQLLFTGALYSQGERLLRGEPFGVKESVKAGLPRLIMLVLTVMVVSMATGAAAVVSFIILGLGGVAVAVLLYVAPPSVVVEGLDPIKAVQRSWALVRPHFWRAVLLVVGAGLLSAQIEYALVSPTAIRQFVMLASAPDALRQTFSLGWTVFDGLMQGAAITLVVPFTQLVTFLFYLDLRSRNEGMDLLIRARELAPGPR
jgi:hypothetical protein